MIDPEELRDMEHRFAKMLPKWMLTSTSKFSRDAKVNSPAHVLNSRINFYLGTGRTTTRKGHGAEVVAKLSHDIKVEFFEFPAGAIRISAENSG